MQHVNRSHMPATKHILTALVLGALALSGCSSNNSDTDTTATITEPDPTEPDPTEPDPTDPDTQLLAFVSGETATRDAGQIERISITDGYISTGKYPATLSDIRADTDGTNLYQIGRYNIDTLTRFSATDTSVVDFQFSVNGDEIASNPYDITFASDTKAYVTRYGSDKVWIIDPSATEEANFKTGELDLSAYDEDAPNADSAIIVDGKLYILMQRLTGFTADKQGYVAVFDTTTDTEIDTGMGAEDGLLGIALGVTNPTGITYNTTTEEMYVLGRGNLYGLDPVNDPYEGGLIAINTADYSHSMQMDDGTADENRGFYGQALVVSDELGYVELYEGYDAGVRISKIHSFNLATGTVSEEAMTELSELHVSTMAQDPNGNVWFGVHGEAPGFVVINPSDGSVVQSLVSTEFNPNNVVFIQTTP